MDNYKIVLTPQSYRDLDDVYSLVLRLSADRDTAHNYIETIKSSILKLKTFPKRGTIRTTGKHKGYRQIFIKEYSVVYRIDEAKKQVIVVTIKPKKDKT
ncbi:type II toxin-antitoxin system RelE/ParE family toxin [Butyrivibrio sp.]|uniref:type II toxin-antitoxin system RelE/ParE family toxin n=1 Tax=Butyrivibrio sp. TaxID=28121 RepID=UPI0025C37A60|nr:type II toxin-antitoxin system RelE/ParE family toxin [Butyrivibrio sp.]MBQ9303994.1 type II toxin-antitoxin system RelE/ParE family toxin [Butyrivibrio sp.]